MKKVMKVIKENKDFPFKHEHGLANKAEYYLDDFLKIADNPIWKELSVRGVKLSGKTIKRAYKEMEEMKFSGDIIDYLCFVALSYALSQSFIMEKLTIIGHETNVKVFSAFLEKQKIYLILSCRLMLTDEKYLDYVFMQCNVPKGDFYNGAKKYLFEKMNELLVVTPGMHAHTKHIVKLH